MAKLARVRVSTGMVENIIMPYSAPEGFLDVEVSDDSPVTAGWQYVDGSFINPVAPEMAAIEAQEAYQFKAPLRGNL